MFSFIFFEGKSQGLWNIKHITLKIENIIESNRYSSTKVSFKKRHCFFLFSIPQVDLIETFDIVQIVGEGWFGKILLVEHRGTDNEMVLKSLPKNYTAVKDFYREFHFSYHLSAHRNIVSTFDVAFQTASFYVFAQEYAPLGDLTSNISDTGIGELHSKSVAKQVRWQK